MSELIKERVKESVDKTMKIFLNNGFRYEGKIINSDEEYVQILDFKINKYKFIKFNDIKDCEVGE